MHFAGSWYESNMWENLNTKKDVLKNKLLKKLKIYQKKNIQAKIYGSFKPKQVSKEY